MTDPDAHSNCKDPNETMQLPSSPAAADARAPAHALIANPPTIDDLRFLEELSSSDELRDPYEQLRQTRPPKMSDEDLQWFHGFIQDADNLVRYTEPIFTGAPLFLEEQSSQVEHGELEHPVSLRESKADVKPKSHLSE
jgi:hypothetical protein